MTTHYIATSICQMPSYVEMPNYSSTPKCPPKPQMPTNKHLVTGQQFTGNMGHQLAKWWQVWK